MKIVTVTTPALMIAMMTTLKCISDELNGVTTALMTIVTARLMKAVIAMRVGLAI